MASRPVLRKGDNREDCFLDVIRGEFHRRGLCGDLLEAKVVSEAVKEGR